VSQAEELKHLRDQEEKKRRKAEKRQRKAEKKAVKAEKKALRAAATAAAGEKYWTFCCSLRYCSIVMEDVPWISHLSMFFAALFFVCVQLCCFFKQTT
jgi:hypothetical protein